MWLPRCRSSAERRAKVPSFWCARRSSGRWNSAKGRSRGAPFFAHARSRIEESNAGLSDDPESPALNSPSSCLLLIPPDPADERIRPLARNCFGHCILVHRLLADGIRHAARGLGELRISLGTDLDRRRVTAATPLGPGFVALREHRDPLLQADLVEASR